MKGTKLFAKFRMTAVLRERVCTLQTVMMLYLSRSTPPGHLPGQYETRSSYSPLTS